jgi:hypothetical protein
MSVSSPLDLYGAIGVKAFRYGLSPFVRPGCDISSSRPVFR